MDQNSSTFFDLPLVQNVVPSEASNITPDKNTGIGNYTEAEFLKALKEGVAPDKKPKIPMLNLPC